MLTSSTAIYRVMRYRNPVKEDEARIGLLPEMERESRELHLYSLGKREAEEVLFGTMDEETFPFTIIRPPVVQGEGDPSLREYFWIQRVLDGGPVLIPDGGLYAFRHVYASDLARAYLLAIDNERAVNRAYNIAQEEILTLKEYVASICEVLGVGFKPVYVPSKLAEKCIGYRPPYFRSQVLIPDITRARTELNFQSTPFKRWLGKTVRWFVEDYKGHNSPGYDQRLREVKLSEIWQEKEKEIERLWDL